MNTFLKNLFQRNWHDLSPNENIQWKKKDCICGSNYFYKITPEKNTKKKLKNKKKKNVRADLI